LLVEKRTRGKVTAKAVMSGIGMAAVLIVQWLSMGVLINFSMPLWLVILVSVCAGLLSRFAVTYFMTSRSLRPSTLGAKYKRLLSFYATCWSDFLLNTGATFALCKLGCPWPLAALVGVCLAEARYIFGKKTGVSA
jgi:dolichol-phosphate mannosyltransferase